MFINSQQGQKALPKAEGRPEVETMLCVGTLGTSGRTQAAPNSVKVRGKRVGNGLET